MIALATHGHLTHMPSFILRQVVSEFIEPLSNHARALYAIMTSSCEWERKVIDKKITTPKSLI